MNPNNPDKDDISKVLNLLAKRQRSDIQDTSDIFNNLKIICIERMRIEIASRNLKIKDFKNYLNDLEMTLEAIKQVLQEDKKTSVGKSSLLSMIIVHLQLCKDMKIAINKQGKKFNAIKFLDKESENVIHEEKKESKIKRKKIVDEYESDSSDNTSDEEKPKPTKKAKHNTYKEDEKDDGDDGDDGDDDDSDDEDNEDDEDDEDKLNRNFLNNKIGKEFIEQLHKGKGGSSDDIEDESLKYFANLSNKDRKEALMNLKELNNYKNSDKPILFQIMGLDLKLDQKNHILKNYITIATSRFENNKLKQWVDSVMTVPFGQFKGINLTSIKPEKVKDFLEGLQKSMDDAAYGHDEAKRQIIQMMGQQIRNPKAKGNMLGIWGCPGNGKCFALDTPILMHNGEIKKVQDIKIGDVIMGDDSRPRNILSLGSGEDEMYDIISNKGEKYNVNSEHILCLKRSGLNMVCKKNNKFKVQYFMKDTYKFHTKIFENRDDANKYLNDLISKEEDDVVEITIKDYLKLSKNISIKLKGYKTGVEFEKKDVLFDPYIIGLWLGDGSSACTGITSQDSTILSYLRTNLKKYNLNLNFTSNYAYNIVCDTTQNTRLSKNVFKNALKHYNLLGNKHIPNDYKINDRETRLKLLAGLIDTDGYYNKTMKN